MLNEVHSKVKAKTGKSAAENDYNFLGWCNPISKLSLQKTSAARRVSMQLDILVNCGCCSDPEQKHSRMLIKAGKY